MIVYTWLYNILKLEVTWVDYQDWFAERLARLRIEKGVSARDMSLSLGQSESYINKIENRRTLPSMAGFFSICEYLEIEPKAFFDTETVSPAKTAELIYEIGKLPPVKAEHILCVIRDLNGSTK